MRINAIVSKDPMPYFPICVMAKEAFQKGKLANSSFAAAYSPWTVGYMAGKAAVQTLGKKRIFFLARTDSWGWDMRDGAYAAAKEFGAEIVGYDETALGTNDFTTILQKVRAAKPDVLIAAQFAANSVALLKQVSQMGLNKEMTIFNAFITNVVAKGLPPEALQGVYAMHYFYYDLSSFPDKAVAKSAQEFTELFRAKYGTPPDAYATIAYVAYMEMFRGFEAAKSLDPKQVSAALMANGGQFDTVKGPATWRQDHSAAYKYAAFLVKGKGAAERKNEWDLFTRGRLHGRRLGAADAQGAWLLILAAAGRLLPAAVNLRPGASRLAPGQRCQEQGETWTRAPRSSEPKASPNASASRSRSITSATCCTKTRSPASSARTAPARPRFSIC